MDDAALREAVRTTRVFARTSPAHKIAPRAGTAGQRGDRRDDRRRRQRRTRAQAGRRRRGHGRKGTEAAKQAGGDRARRRQLRLDRAAVRGRAHRLRQSPRPSPSCCRSTAANRCHLLLAILLGVDPADRTGADPLGQHGQLDGAGDDVRVRADRGRRRCTARRAGPTSRCCRGFVAWRIGLVSTLFLAGIFGMFDWSLRAGRLARQARTVGRQHAGGDGNLLPVQRALPEGGVVHVSGRAGHAARC